MEVDAVSEKWISHGTIFDQQAHQWKRWFRAGGAFKYHYMSITTFLPREEVIPSSDDKKELVASFPSFSHLWS